MIHILSQLGPLQRVCRVVPLSIVVKRELFIMAAFSVMYFQLLLGTPPHVGSGGGG